MLHSCIKINYLIKMEYIVSVLLSIIGNLLTPTAKKILRWPAEPDTPTRIPLPEIKEQEFVTDEEKEIIREYNRQRLDRIGRLIWIHLSTFLVLFAALYLPLMWKSMPGENITLSSTRLAFLGFDYAISHQRIGLLSVLVSLLLYIPIWTLSQHIGHLVATVWDHVSKVTVNRYTSLIALSAFGLAFIVAGHWVFILFPQNSYLYSVGLPFFAIAMAGIFSSGRR